MTKEYFLRWAVASGMVSALYCKAVFRADIMDCLQTAAISVAIYSLIHLGRLYRMTR